MGGPPYTVSVSALRLLGREDRALLRGVGQVRDERADLVDQAPQDDAPGLGLTRARGEGLLGRRGLDRRDAVDVELVLGGRAVDRRDVERRRLAGLHRDPVALL